jgi:hypothetical protein
MLALVHIYLILFKIMALSIVLFGGGRTSLSHPLSLFVLLYYAYSTWYIYIQLIMGDAESSLLIKCLSIAIVGLGSYCAGVKTGLACVRVNKLVSRPLQSAGFGVERIVFFAIILGSLYSFYVVLLAGFTTKREVVDSGMYHVVWLNYSTWILVAVVLLKRIRAVNVPIYSDAYLWIYSLIAVLMYAIAGERDVLYRLVFGLACIWSDRSQVGRPLIVFITFALIVVATPLSQLFKSFMIAESFKTVELNLAFLFTGEFASASRNLYLILFYEERQSWHLLFSDIVRGLIPFISSRLGLYSSAYWFNQVFRHDVGIAGASGWGFGLLAQGYMVSGYIGAITLMFLIGIIIGILYVLRLRSEYWYVFYILGLATTIYCLRADVAHFVSQVFKVGGGVVFLTYLLSRIKFRADNQA